MLLLYGISFIILLQSLNNIYSSICSLLIHGCTGVATLYLLLHFIFSGTLDATDIPMLLVGYGFGASFVALFMQLGGGIYTKAADVGMCLSLTSYYLFYNLSN
jgi:Na+/H+-translocating membrane pyrophosphatase